MKISIFLFTAFLCFVQACGQVSTRNKVQANEKDSVSGKDNSAVNAAESVNPKGKTIESRFMPPGGFERISVSNNSFAKYLRQLPLKPPDSKVLLYDGSIKENYGVYDAVVDLKIGNKDLHQCADAVMRLRAEYLYQQKLYDKIHFNFTNGFRVDYSEWIKGNRIANKGNKTYWVKSAAPSNTYQDFWNYMEIIFSYAGTLSLSKELQTVVIDSLKIGDIFIQGGSPGHAIIVVDVAVNNRTKETVFILAQSYMPAQELQVLQNPVSRVLSPWYSSNFGAVLNTPEWTFYNTDLKRFQEE
jgi:hypothetical protein